MKITGEDGVEISYDGNISTNNGYLISGNQETIPWVIYSNDSLVLNSVEYSFNPNIFYYGDPSYLTNNNEYGDGQSAPWLRNEWINPPTP